MSVEIPDALGPEDRGDDSKPGLRSILSAVGLVIVVGFILGSQSPQSADQTTTTLPEGETTTTTLPQLNDPLDWQADELGATAPLGLVEFGGSLYFFASTGPVSPPGEIKGLDAWVLVDGVSWKPLGTVIEHSYQIHTVAATPRGLFAAGSSDGRTLHLWSSSDAVEWHRSDLPEAPSTSDDFNAWVHAIGGTEDVTVVIASSSPEIETVLDDLLPDNLRDAEGNLPPNMGWGGPPWRVSVHGPLGLTVFSATPEDLGLTELETQELLGEGQENTNVAWASIDGQTWTPVDLDVGYASSFLEVDGDLIVGGYGVAGYEEWASSDGFEWEREARVGRDNLVRWRDGFVALQQGTTSDIAFSEDRTAWEPLSVSGYLADEYSWYFQTLAAGEGGLASVATGYDNTGFSPGDLEPAVLERDGYTLTFDGMGGPVVLESGDDVLLSLGTYSNQAYDEVAVDFRERSVTFLDPESLEAMVSFTFEEIEGAEAAVLKSRYVMAEEQQVVAFSADGSTWSIESVFDAFGEDAYVNRLYVTGDQVIAVIAEYPNLFSSVPTAPNVVIWSAVIP